MSGEALSYIVDQAHGRRERWKHVEVSRLPSLDVIHESTIVGSFSFCLQSTRRRIIKAPDCIPVDHVIETPAAIARDYAMFEYKRGPRVKHVQMLLIRDGLRAAPNVSIPTRFDHGYYVDIRAAYWSIMNIVGWNPDYWPGKFLGRGKPPSGFPFPDSKLARNCLASVGLGDKIPVYDPETKEITPIKRGNPLANVSIMRVITDVLHSIAGTAIEMGAVYINNDGFIAPDEIVLERLLNLIAEWGLVARIKAEGDGGVFSSGDYQLGKTKSGFRDMRRDDAMNLNVSQPKYHRWLQKSFTFWAAKAGSST